jgi:hypothetical protein
MVSFHSKTGNGNPISRRVQREIILERHDRQNDPEIPDKNQNKEDKPDWK